MYTAEEGGGGGGREGWEGVVAEDILKGQNFFVSPLLSKRKNDNPPPA